MSYIMFDEDEWERVVNSDPHSCSMGMRRRPWEEVLKIKEEKRRKREDAILAEAAQIILRRASE